MFAPLHKAVLSDEELVKIRRELYHSEGPGYHIFRSFLSDYEVQHIRHVWTQYPWEMTHIRHPGKDNLVSNSPDLYLKELPGSESYWNFHWNISRRCTFTQEACAAAHMLRNTLMGKAPFFELSPTDLQGQLYATSYRVVMSTDAEELVKEHADWGPRENILDKRYQLQRLQNTLFLSEHGVDYTGDGFYMVGRDGVKRHICQQENIRPGDLLVWAYNTPHGVGSVKALGEDGPGYMRIVMPSERLDRKRIYTGGRTAVPAF
ncbi:hypothetical protein [Kordiimonas aestuarii]|uniref:hypothetical protein n=1 Tax=Kordiimonas aestuarii TaxID=1005925 RepID=UPI0021CFADF4|nr:hypothetical protein [Kordiimonas aestuarii]